MKFLKIIGLALFSLAAMASFTVAGFVVLSSPRCEEYCDIQGVHINGKACGACNTGKGDKPCAA